MHKSNVNPPGSNFRVITANFLGVQIFRIFTVWSIIVTIIMKTVEKSMNAFSVHFWFNHDQTKLSHSTTKPIKWHVLPAKTQTSLHIGPVWSVFAVHFMGSQCGQWRLWSDCTDVQANLAHRSFCWFCHNAAQFKKWPMAIPVTPTVSRLRKVLTSHFWDLARFKGL